MFEPKRLFGSDKNSILFDAGVKKLSRYQQYFAIHKMLERISEEETGKEVSLAAERAGLAYTGVWEITDDGHKCLWKYELKILTLAIRVIIVTDRKDFG